MKYKLPFKMLPALLLGCSMLTGTPFSNAQTAVSQAAPPEAVAPLPYFLFLSDVHLNASTTAPTCMGADAGLDLWAKCKEKLDSIVSSPTPPKFLLYTGDLPVHNQPNPIRQKAIKTMLQDLGALAKKGRIPVLYAPGNNDALQGNYYPFSGTGYGTPFSLVNPKASSGFPYRLFGIHEASTLSEPYMLSDQNTPSGYWSVHVMDGLRVICLNTVLWGTTIASIVDSNSLRNRVRKEMRWLARQLQDAAESGDKVFLAMHIPPGSDAYAIEKGYSKTSMWNSWWNYSIEDSFLTLTERYQATVTGIFYGHTHYDELRLLYNQSGDAVRHVAFSCPGVSTEHQNYPAFKLVQFDPVRKTPMDFRTYFMPLDCSKPSAVWGDNNYTFSGMFGSGPGVSIYDRLQSMDTSMVQSRMSFIYKAGNGCDNEGASGVRVTW